MECPSHSIEREFFLFHFCVINIRNSNQEALSLLRIFRGILQNLQCRNQVTPVLDLVQNIHKNPSDLFFLLTCIKHGYQSCDHLLLQRFSLKNLCIQSKRSLSILQIYAINLCETELQDDEFTIGSKRNLGF